MIFTIKGQKVLFIHIPRTGGTYIENIFAKSVKKWPKANKSILFGLHKNGRNQYFILQHLTATEMITHYQINMNMKSFTIVRNPFDRVISLFHKWKQTDFDQFLDTLEQMDLNNYPHNGVMTDKEFNHRNMMSQMELCRYHFIPQYKYICDDNDKPLVKYFHFDQMEKLNEYLNVKHIKYKSKKRDTELLTKSRRQKIYQIYRKDFEIFGFNIT